MMSMERVPNVVREDNALESKEDFIKRCFTYKECQLFIPIETEGGATLYVYEFFA